MSKKADQETVQLHPPKESEIIRETQKDGTIVFKDSNKELETDDIDLHSLNYHWFSQLWGLIELLDDEDYGRFGSVFEILIERFINELDETYAFIRQTIGHIKIYRIHRNQWPHRNGRVVQITLEPPEEEKKGGESA